MGRFQTLTYFCLPAPWMPQVISVRVGVYAHGWSARDARIRGWNDKSVAEAQEKHWPTLLANLQGAGPLGVSHFPFARDPGAPLGSQRHDVLWLCFSFGRRERRRVWRSWIGAAELATIISIARRCSDVKFDYHCHDLPNLCRLGAKLLPTSGFTIARPLCPGGSMISYQQQLAALL